MKLLRPVEHVKKDFSIASQQSTTCILQPRIVSEKVGNLARSILPILFLFGITCLMTAFEARTAFAQTEHSKTVITLNAVTPITENLTPQDYMFELVYNLSNYFLNNNARTNLTIPQGVLGWSYGNQSIYNVTISDNLGNYFTPIDNGKKVSNPEAYVIVPAGFEYRVSLSFSTNQGVIFDANKMLYELAVGGTMTTSQMVSLRIPQSFTVLECTPNATKQQDKTYTRFTWPKSAKLEIFATFVPFHLEGTTRSFTFTVDIPSVTPIGSVSGTFQETFTTPRSFSIWPINPLFAIKVPFPEYAQVLNISRVWDGIGTCSVLDQEPKELDNNTLGHYYIDSANRELIMYPRYNYQGDFYQYAVGTTFVTPPEYKPFQMKAVKEDILPYRYESYLIIEEVLFPANWKLNITGDVQIKFTLPTGAQILREESGNPEVNLENGRPTALFVYHSPGTLSPSGWRVIYEMTRQKHLFWLEVASLVIVITITIVVMLLLFWKRIVPKASHILIPLLTLFVGLLTYNLSTYMSLGWSKPLFLDLLIVEMILSVVTIVIVCGKLWKNLDQN
jgi:hypothetical protein